MRNSSFYPTNPTTFYHSTLLIPPLVAFKYVLEIITVQGHETWAYENTVVASE